MADEKHIALGRTVNNRADTTIYYNPNNNTIYSNKWSRSPMVVGSSEFEKNFGTYNPWVKDGIATYWGNVEEDKPKEKVTQPHEKDYKPKSTYHESPPEVEKIVKGEMTEYDKTRSRREKIINKDTDSAFSKLSDVDALKQRQAELSQTAHSGLSLQQKQAEKAQVGAAIRGQQKSIGRRMQSVLGGQGMRGVAASSVMRSIDNKAKKQSAQFEMGQMARSYAEKQKAGDKKAAMDMDIKQFDIGQDKSGLEFKEARKRKPLERRASLLNALSAQGLSGKKGKDLGFTKYWTTDITEGE